MPHTPPEHLALSPVDDEPDWFALLNDSVPVEARYTVRTIEPWIEDNSLSAFWTWHWAGGARELRLQLNADGSIHADVSGPGVHLGISQRRPFTATQLWTLCVLVGLLPERSGA